MLHRPALTCLLLAWWAIAFCTSGSARESVTFDALLAETGLALARSDLVEEIDLPKSALFAPQKAFRHKNSEIEVWYAIRPLARVEIKYDDPHGNEPSPDHIFPLVFQTMIGRLATHGHSPTRTYPAKTAKEMFNADWAAAAIFDNDPELGSRYSTGFLLALHKNGKGDAYVLMQFDDAQAAKPKIDELLGLLRFTAD